MFAVTPVATLPADRLEPASPPALRALLVAADPEEALRMSELFADLSEPRVALAWVPTSAAAQRVLTGEGHDLYLFDSADADELRELAAHLRLAGSVAPLIAIVPADDDLAEQAALDAGAADTLPRGAIDSTQLGRSLRRALHHARTLAEARNPAASHQLMIDASTTPIVILDGALTVVAVNLAWRRFAEEQAFPVPDYGLGGQYPGLCAPGDVADAALLRGIADVAAGQRRDFSYEYSCVGARGERWIFVRVLPHAAVGAGGVLIAHEDISAQVSNRELARRREQAFRALVEHNPDLIARFDRHLNRVYVNPAMLAGFDLLGIHPPAEPTAFTGPLAAPAARLYHDLEMVFATAREHAAEYVIPLPEAPSTYQVRLVPERGAEGMPESVLLIGRDITARVAAEAALRARGTPAHPVSGDSAPDLYLAVGRR